MLQTLKSSLQINKIKNNLNKKLWQSLGLKWKLRSGLTVKIESQAEWVIYNDIFVDREYDIPINKTLESNLDERPLTIIDIGANVGFFTLRLADLILQGEHPKPDFRVTLVEGSPTIYKELTARLANEPVLAEKLNLIHGLIGKRQGSDKIIECDFHVMNFLAPNNSSVGVRVPYIDLNLLFPDSYEIDLLKCDIEGAELIFIENYKDFLVRVKHAVFELHHDKCDVAKCFEILRSVGFGKHQLLRRGSTYSLEFFWKE